MTSFFTALIRLSKLYYFLFFFFFQTSWSFLVHWLPHNPPPATILLMTMPWVFFFYIFITFTPIPKSQRIVAKNNHKMKIYKLLKAKWSIELRLILSSTIEIFAKANKYNWWGWVSVEKLVDGGYINVDPYRLWNGQIRQQETRIQMTSLYT